jgi:hypothetical protein
MVGGPTITFASALLQPLPGAATLTLLSGSLHGAASTAKKTYKTVKQHRRRHR